MAKVGRPSKYRADFHPEDFLRLANQGKVLAQIAREWRIDRDTINVWAGKHEEFARTVKMGKQWAEAWWMDLFQGAAVGIMPKDPKTNLPLKFNAVPAIWLTKNAFNWLGGPRADDPSTKVLGDTKYVAAWGSTAEPGTHGDKDA